MSPRAVSLGALVVAAATAGCASEPYVNLAYSTVPAYYMSASNGQTYEIYERNDIRRVAITVMAPPTRLPSAVAGLVLDNIPIELEKVNGARSPGSAYFFPLRQYFAQTGRNCELRNGRALVEPQWEFEYLCRGPALAADPGVPAPYQVPHQPLPPGPMLPPYAPPK